MRVSVTTAGPQAKESYVVTQDTYSGHFGRSGRKRRRLVSPRHRRALAHGLRRTAASTQPPTRFDICPILLDRVAPLRPELLQLATALEQTHDPDPTSVALIHELLRNGCSPLYNPNAPAADLHAVLRRARAGFADSPVDEIIDIADAGAVRSDPQSAIA
jgi:hypothetical protein